jgi:hypothetical protein
MNRKRWLVRDDIWTDNPDGTRTHSYGPSYRIEMSDSDAMLYKLMGDVALFFTSGILATILAVAVS